MKCAKLFLKNGQPAKELKLLFKTKRNYKKNKMAIKKRAGWNKLNNKELQRKNLWTYQNTFYIQ